MKNTLNRLVLPFSLNLILYFLLIHLLAFFENLKNLEIKEGFKVNPSKKPFFRKGKVGDWKEKLSKDQTQKIEKAFKAEMIELGYL